MQNPYNIFFAPRFSLLLNSLFFVSPPLFLLSLFPFFFPPLPPLLFSMSFSIFDYSESERAKKIVVGLECVFVALVTGLLFFIIIFFFFLFFYFSSFFLFFFLSFLLPFFLFSFFFSLSFSPFFSFLRFLL